MREKEVTQLSWKLTPSYNRQFTYSTYPPSVSSCWQQNRRFVIEFSHKPSSISVHVRGAPVDIAHNEGVGLAVQNAYKRGRRE